MVAEPTIALSSSQSTLAINSNDINNHLMKHIDHYDDDVKDKNKNDHAKKKQVEMVKKELNERDADGEGVDDNDMDVSIHNRDGDECDDDLERVSIYHIYHYLSIATNYYIRLSYIFVISIIFIH